MTMPAGTYWIGDPCYVMHDRWDEVCKLTISERTCLEGEFQLKDGTLFSMYHTAYGDGEYPDQDGNHYGVDSGCLGCIAVKDIAEDEKSRMEELGRIATFPEQFRTGSSVDGTVSIGRINIFTGDQEDDDEYDPHENDQWEENGR